MIGQTKDIIILINRRNVYLCLDGRVQAEIGRQTFLSCPSHAVSPFLPTIFPLTLKLYLTHDAALNNYKGWPHSGAFKTHVLLSMKTKRNLPTSYSALYVLMICVKRSGNSVLDT